MALMCYPTGRPRGSAGALQRCLLAALCLTGLGFGGAGVLHAQAFELNRFSPAPLAGDGFALSGGQTPGHLKPNVSLHFDYGREPLAIVLANGDEYSVVSDQLTLHAAAALGLGERLAVFGVLPVNAVMSGEDPPAGIVNGAPPADGAGLGDARLGARFRLLGDNDGLLQLALQAGLAVPLASTREEQRYSGDKRVGFEPQAILQARVNALVIRANLGARLRRGVDLQGVAVGSELTYGLGLEAALFDRTLRLLAEARAASLLEDMGSAAGRPAELLAGARVHLGNLYAGLGAGPGISGGLGTPVFRGIASFGYAPTEPTDPDGDGMLGDADHCPLEAEDLDGHEDTDGCPDPDNDGDGVPDSDDRCTGQPEDTDGHEDGDGCPDPDNDGDGVVDSEDRCPGHPEDTDGHEDADGCPDPDNDGDGVTDSEDRCPAEPEDMDGHEDTDGCPDPDNDGDGVPDSEDQCPETKGAPEAAGCLPDVRVDRDQGTVEIKQRVEFAEGKAELLGESNAILGQVQALLASDPAIARVRVEGHTDSSGSAKFNLGLSKERAQAVVTWLVDAGIPADKLQAMGCGESRPLVRNTSPNNRKLNRRVELHIVEPPPSQPAPSTVGCEAVTE